MRAGPLRFISLKPSTWPDVEQRRLFPVIRLGIVEPIPHTQATMNRSMPRLTLCLAFLLFLAGIVAVTVAAEKKKKIVYITKAVDPFWNVAAAGVRDAAKDFSVDTEVLMPPKGIVDQKRMLETALVRGVDGVAISPIDAKNQIGLINEACAQTKVITHDSDAPESKRICFVGMDNYKAGRAAGKLVKEALPE